MFGLNKHVESIPAIAPPNGRYAVETRGLNVYYGDFLAIHDVNLKIQRRKITSIIGPSGCGKSTM